MKAHGLRLVQCHLESQLLDPLHDCRNPACRCFGRRLVRLSPRQDQRVVCVADHADRRRGGRRRARSRIRCSTGAVLVPIPAEHRTTSLAVSTLPGDRDRC
ncbi:hypothetical protein PYW07_000991 [Mythimna separata]|uniref:Uncharacterized protein n=1 Tax=Mythimna separata TaxID=271217 RepID=A0AAD8DVH4_MYTSE|nr:hypothetical protein PYW07_000991 [Mythimna separata]